jgi:ureidoglycolate dehydrogenase (NAD+)
MPGKIAAEQLQDFCERVLCRVGVSAEHASIVAQSLVRANLRGVDTHGVMRLPIYVHRITQGLINARPEMRLLRTGDGTATLDADDGPGQVATLEAMLAAVSLSRDAGVGAVSVRNSNHFGAAAFFAIEANKADMIGIAMTHAEADVVPYGGRVPKLGTNPIAVAVPSGDRFPIVLDMATSIVSMGKVMVAAADGTEIPVEWAVDDSGDPCTDPKRVRAVRPMGGAKGYGLGLIIDVLCALLAGAAFGPGVRRMYHDFSTSQRIAHFVLAIDPGRFVPVDLFKRRVRDLIQELKLTPPATGFDEVMIPGEIEARIEAERRAAGILLSDAVVAELRDLGEKYEVEL